MSETNPFRGRTLAVAGDLSVDEQRYLYRKTRELKETYLAGGDVSATWADTSALAEAAGYEPTTGIETGLPAFADWYREYYGIG